LQPAVADGRLALLDECLATEAEPGAQFAERDRFDLRGTVRTPDYREPEFRLTGRQARQRVAANRRRTRGRRRRTAFQCARGRQRLRAMDDDTVLTDEIGRQVGCCA